MVEKQYRETYLADGWKRGEPYVFVSYASRDWEKVYPTVLCLRSMGINVYIDVEFKENQSSNWLDNFQERLLHDPYCTGIIAFLSISYLRSYACMMEQLANLTEEMLDNAGKTLPVFYISLEPEMDTLQSMKEYLYSIPCRAESETMPAEMVGSEFTTLKEFLTHLREPLAPMSAEEAESFIRKIHTRHNVAAQMYKLVLEKRVPSIQSFQSAERCAEHLYNNFVGEKNQEISLTPSSALKQETMERIQRAGGSVPAEFAPPSSGQEASQQRAQDGGSASAESAPSSSGQEASQQGVQDGGSAPAEPAPPPSELEILQQRVQSGDNSARPALAVQYAQLGRWDLTYACLLPVADLPGSQFDATKSNLGICCYNMGINSAYPIGERLKHLSNAVHWFYRAGKYYKEDRDMNATYDLLRTVIEQCLPLARNGDVEIQYQLGLWYQRNECRQRNRREAANWFEKAAQQGHAEAQYEYGWCFRPIYDGRDRTTNGRAANSQKAAEWWLKSAEQGYAPAQNQIADCYQNGAGVERDLQKAAEWRQRAAIQQEAPPTT